MHKRAACAPRSRGSTGRSASNPRGWEHYDSVAQQNVLVARTIIILLICQAKRVWWVLEQPVGSLMQHHPTFQAFLKLAGIKVQRLTTSMVWFGGETKKPTWLYSSFLVQFSLGLKEHLGPTI